jgi:hypothetical protein
MVAIFDADRWACRAAWQAAADWQCGLGPGRRQNSGVTNPAQDAILPHCLMSPGGRMPGDPANSNKASQKKRAVFFNPVAFNQLARIPGILRLIGMASYFVRQGTNVSPRSLRYSFLSNHPSSLTRKNAGTTLNLMSNRNQMTNAATNVSFMT